MSLTPFEIDLGSASGRIEPVLAPAPAGTYAFALGHETPGRIETFEPGDYDEVTQSVTITTEQLIWVVLQVRAPKLIPVGSSWKVALRFNGAEVVSTTLQPGETREIRWAVPVRAYGAGTYVLGVRLSSVLRAPLP